MWEAVFWAIFVLVLAAVLLTPGKVDRAEARAAALRWAVSRGLAAPLAVCAARPDGRVACELRARDGATEIEETLLCDADRCDVDRPGAAW